jgi:hypothetical protein
MPTKIQIVIMSNLKAHNLKTTIHQEEETLEELVAKAKTSLINSGGGIQLQKGLAILYVQGDNLTHNCEEIITLQLSDGGLKTLMKRYAANPQKNESLPGPSKPISVQLTSGLFRLTGKITPFDAKEFQTMSDKQGAEHIAMHLLVDDDARFTISSTFTAKAPHLNLPP